MQRCWEAKRKARKNRVRMKVRAWSHYITVHTHAHTLAHMCIHMHTWVHWCTHMLTLVYMHTHAHISTDSYTHAHILHTYIQTCEHGQSCSYLYMHVLVYAFLSIHMYTCKVAIQDICQRFFPVFFPQIFLNAFVMNTGQNLPPKPMCTVPVGLLSHNCGCAFFSRAENNPGPHACHTKHSTTELHLQSCQRF